MKDKRMLQVGFACSADRSESYEEDAIPLSPLCHLVGKRKVAVNKTFSHTIEMLEGSLVTAVRDIGTGYWYIADEKGNYDPAWRIYTDIALENVRFFQGLIVRGFLDASSYVVTGKYCKKLDVNKDCFFLKDGVPVMTAKRAILSSAGNIIARGIK